jgi:apolipoprotein N-acyltransferase
MDFWTVIQIIEALAAAAGFTFLLIGYISTVIGSFAYGTRWGLTALLLPIFGGLYFAYKHRDSQLKEFRLLAGGLACLVLAIALMFMDATHLAGKLKAEQAQREQAEALSK